MFRQEEGDRALKRPATMNVRNGPKTDLSVAVVALGQLYALYVLLEMNSPEWMRKAERVARTFHATTARERHANHSVYVVLLHDPSQMGRWGLYVGQTSRDPDLRFDQHKAGHKASRAVVRFGVRLLPHLVDHLNPMRGWEALDLEAALADGFRSAGIPWIEGGH